MEKIGACTSKGGMKRSSQVIGKGGESGEQRNEPNSFENGLFLGKRNTYDECSVPYYLSDHGNV
jgi:hypothetical protein